MSMHLYVAQGSGGLLKVGMSRSLAKRELFLRKDFAARGQALTRIQYVPVDEGVCRVAERALIAAVAEREERAEGFEWFVSGSFDGALNAARQVAVDCLDTEIHLATKRALYRSFPAPQAAPATRWKAHGETMREVWRIRKQSRCNPVIAHMAREFVAWPALPFTADA